MNNLIINILASQDLNEIADYFLGKNIEAGERFFAAFNQKCQQLVNFPNMGRSYSEISASLRGVPLQGYVILYKVMDDGIEILRVVSGRRDLGSLFSESGSE
ncbi:type II toxin-antitoxin system RelE/ParE family toxin [Iningainema tapete]|uniref:Type II toxin-antitoxin system RelE/ParE family toxin n=1 Tax=Iningainema tapete BLCC-T55 TaxID=2748662 RepID=A0A8J6XMN1_9CYAN|nr:type II toxin-antitoxin system RelE/ParE family toxin [Iningainema tapete]MBD2776022.1 type II toxin-antitoxin system RelE/ParE family toxin [Iningainema tapete BLCC-T55]